MDTESKASIPIEVETRETVYKGNWMGVDRVVYRPKKSKESSNGSTDKPGVWECGYRLSKPVGSEVDGVTVIPILCKPDGSKSVILIKQFRVPLMGYCIEFPAGLIDKGETVTQAALRELKEETGYVSTNVILITKGQQPMDPGLTCSDVQFAIVQVDGSLEANINPQQALDEFEDITVIEVPLTDLNKKLEEFTTEGIKIEASVYAFDLGFMLNSILL